MSGNNATLPTDPATEGTTFEEKGKGKAAAQNIQDEAMDEELDDDDDDDDEEQDEVEAAPIDDDGMEEIDLNNIVEGGRRTRGQVIDFAKAAEENPAEDDDEEDDDDFQPAEENEDTNMSG